MTQTPDAPPEPAAEEMQASTRSRWTRILLRVSMVSLALATFAFAYLTPIWMDRGLTKVNQDRLQAIAEDTARQAYANNWGIEQAVEYAAHQTKLGKLETEVDVGITGAAVTVRIIGTAISANPFASPTDEDTTIRIEAAYTYPN